MNDNYFRINSLQWKSLKNPPRDGNVHSICVTLPAKAGQSGL